MSKPVVYDNKPVSVQLEAGEEYYFCTCGRSGNQPFCDGSHAGTGMQPKSFVADESGTMLSKPWKTPSIVMVSQATSAARSRSAWAMSSS